MIGKRNFRKTKKVVVRRKKVYTRNKVSLSAVKKIVNRQIQKKAETKDVSYHMGPLDFNGPVSNVADALRIIPNLTLGNTNGCRIGDSVHAQKIEVRGHMMINTVFNTTGTNIPTSIPANARLMIRAFICSVKKLSNYDDVALTTSYMNNFLKDGSFTQSLDGTLKSMYLPVNTDVITVHKEFKKFVTIPVIYEKTATATGFSMVPIGFENSVFFFKWIKPLKKTLRYDDDVFSPQNYAPIMVISYAHLDGSSADIITARITASYVSTLFYEDS